MELLHIITLFNFAIICNLQYSTATVCVSSCVGKINGNYQYCPDCRKYVACSNGYAYIMHCPANLVWDDNMMRCEMTSSTCPESTSARTPISELPTGAHMLRIIRSTRPRTIYSTTSTPRTTTPRTTSLRTTTFSTTTASTTCGTDKCSTSPTVITHSSTTTTTTPTSTTTTTIPGSTTITTPTSTPETTIPGYTTTTTPTSTTTTTTPMSTTETTIPGSTTITTPTSTTETTTPGSTTITTPTRTTETTTPGSTTITTPTSTTETTTPTSTTTTTTPMTTTPNECHITTPPTDCCIRKKMRISLEDGDPVVLGNVPFLNVMEKTTGKCGCDAKILLNATFQRHEHGDSCQGCTNVPECGNKMLRIDLEMAPSKTGFSFHVGDSRTNNGYKGDASTQEKDAEFHSLGYEHLLYASDQCPNMSMAMTGLLSNSVTSVTIFIGNEFIRVSNNHGYVYELCSRCLFSLNGQSDSQGPVNEDIFIGLNRIIDSSSYRDGTGVCSAVISWACPWSC